MKHLVKAVDTSVSGILAISLTNNISGFCIILIDTYLPPRNSLYGGSSEIVFNYISSLLTRFENKDILCCLGDYNARISDELDSIKLQT